MSSTRVLQRLAKHMPFEIAAGLNGAFWVDSGKREWAKRGTRKTCWERYHYVRNILHFGLVVRFWEERYFGGAISEERI